MHENRQVLTPTESRQGSPRRLNLRVLVFSMLLAIVVAAMIYYVVYGYPRSEIGVPPGNAPVTERTPAAPPPAP